MGDRENAAGAIAHMPRWVAVHENTLAKLDVVVAIAGAEGYDVDDTLREMDEARNERDKAIGVALDAAPTPDASTAHVPPDERGPR